MKFIVIDKRNGKDITKDYSWVLTSDGRLGCIDYGDFIGITFAEAHFIPYGVEGVTLLRDGRWITYPVEANNGDMRSCNCGGKAEVHLWNEIYVDMPKDKLEE